jgi:hypothetical protein
MAVITVSATGGNFNATAAWVGGVVPTSADDIVGAGTSGQLTVNVASTVRSMDFSAYTNTITFNNTLTLGTASLTNNFGGASTNYAGTSNIISSVASTFVQNNTNRIPGLQLGAGTKTLNTDLYVQKFLNTTGVLVNGNTVFSNGDFGQLTSTSVPGAALQGTTNFVLDGSGLISATYAGTTSLTINTSGTYNTVGRGMVIGADLSAALTPTFNFLSAGTPTLFNTIINKQVANTDTPTLNILVPHNIFILNQTTSAIGTNSILNIRTTSGITCNLLATYNNPRATTTDATSMDVRISGGTVSAQTLNLSSTWRTTSSTTNPPAAGSFTYRSLTLRLDPNYTHYFDKMELSGGGIPDKPVIRSTSGVQVPIVLGDKETSQIVDYDFTDVDASGGEQIVAINGTITNSTNVTNVYPSGGGGGGGSFTFVN